MTTEFVRPTLSDLSSRSGATVRLSWESTPKLLGGKGNAQQGRVTKLSTAVVQLGGTGIYATRKVSEGEFRSSDEVQPRKWGKRVGNSCVVEHKGAEYIEFFVDGKPETSYFLDSDEIRKDEVVGLNDKPRDSNVMIVTVKAANVKLMTEMD